MKVIKMFDKLLKKVETIYHEGTYNVTLTDSEITAITTIIFYTYNSLIEQEDNLICNGLRFLNALNSAYDKINNI